MDRVLGRQYRGSGNRKNGVLTLPVAAQRRTLRRAPTRRAAWIVKDLLVLARELTADDAPETNCRITSSAGSAHTYKNIREREDFVTQLAEDRNRQR